MSESSNNKIYDKRIELARKNYERQKASMQKIMANRESVAQKRDARLDEAIAKTDERLDNLRQKGDERLKASRQRIEEKYIKGDKEKEEKFKARTEKTDKFIAKKRSERDERINSRRRKIKKNRSLVREFNKLYLRVRNIRAKNKLKEVIKDDRERADIAQQLLDQLPSMLISKATEQQRWLAVWTAVSLDQIIKWMSGGFNVGVGSDGKPTFWLLLWWDRRFNLSDRTQLQTAISWWAKLLFIPCAATSMEISRDTNKGRRNKD